MVKKNLKLFGFAIQSATDLSIKKTQSASNRTANKSSPMKATLPLKAASKTQQKHQPQQVTYTPSERNIESKKMSLFYAISIMTCLCSVIFATWGR